MDSVIVVGVGVVVFVVSFVVVGGRRCKGPVEFIAANDGVLVVCWGEGRVKWEIGEK